MKVEGCIHLNVGFHHDSLGPRGATAVFYCGACTATVPATLVWDRTNQFALGGNQRLMAQVVVARQLMGLATVT